MEMRCRVAVLALPFAGVLLAGAVGARAAAVVVLPRLDQTAQSAALGNGAAALTGVNALGVNPGGLYSRQAELLTQYQQLPLQTSLTKLAASYPLQTLDTTMAVSYLTLRSSNFDRRDDAGNQTGRFATQDQLLGLHLSRRLGEESPLAAGVSVKYLRMGIDSSAADAVAFDAGARYAFPSLPLTVGVSAVNIGRGPRFSDQASALPLSYLLSASYRLPGGLELLGNLADRAAENKRELGLGFQYSIGGMLSLRARYGVAQGAPGTQSAASNLTAGLGFKLFGAHSLDYAFQPFDSALQQSAGAGSHLVTLTLRFGDGGRAPRRESELAERGDSRRQARGDDEVSRALTEGRFILAAVKLRQEADANPASRELRGRLKRAQRLAAAMPEARGEEGQLPLIRAAARRYVLEGDAGAAAGLLRRAFDAQPDNDSVLALLNQVEQSGGLGLTRRAGEAPRASLAELKIQAARSALLESRPSAALQRAEEALALEPDNLVALQLLGSAYYVAGDAPAARKAWLRVRELDPSNEAVARFLRDR